MALKLDGVVLDLDKPPESLQRIQKFLDSKKDEMYTVAGLREVADVRECAVRKFAKRYPSYAVHFGARGDYRFGNPAVIAEFKKLVAARQAQK